MVRGCGRRGLGGNRALLNHRRQGIALGSDRRGHLLLAGVHEGHVLVATGGRAKGGLLGIQHRLLREHVEAGVHAAHRVVGELRGQVDGGAHLRLRNRVESGLLPGGLDAGRFGTHELGLLLAQAI